MLNIFANSYWLTLNEVLDSNSDLGLKSALFNSEKLSIEQVNALRNIPKINNLFKFEETFDNNPQLIEKFIASFPYSTLISVQDNKPLRLQILSEFAEEFQKVRSTNKLEQNINSTFTKNTQQTITTNTEQEYEEKYLINEKSSQFDIAIQEPEDNPEVLFEAITSAPVRIPKSVNNSLQSNKQQKLKADEQRQEQLKLNGITENITNMSKPNLISAQRSTLSKKSNFQKAVYAGIASSIGFTGGIISYLTILNP